MRFVISRAFICLLPLSCAGEDSQSASGEPEGGGACPSEFEVLEPEDVREGISGAQIITEFEDMWTSDADWIGTVEDGTVEFEEKGTTTLISMKVDYEEGQIRFFEAGGTGAVGCAARFGIDVVLDVATADGVLTVARPAELVRPAVSDAELAEQGVYRAGIRLELDATEDMSGLEVTALSPEPAQPLQPILDTGFRQDGSWDGSITASLNVSTGSGLGTGHEVVFAEW